MRMFSSSCPLSRQDDEVRLVGERETLFYKPRQDYHCCLMYWMTADTMRTLSFINGICVLGTDLSRYLHR